MASDRIFGLIVILVALAYIASATQIQSSFMTDPVGPKTFPFLIGAVAGLCGFIVFVIPSSEPNWPNFSTMISLLSAVVVLVCYAYMLKPFGFLIPTAIVASILSFQINSKVLNSLFTGTSLSIFLYILFKYVLGLGLIALPKMMLN
mgnify:CR=1 FL=1